MIILLSTTAKLIVGCLAIAMILMLACMLVVLKGFADYFKDYDKKWGTGK